MFDNIFSIEDIMVMKCTCPSGDDSLKHPCQIHPPAQPDEREASTDTIPLHEDMLRALEHVECVYRLNVVKDGEPSSTLANLQRVIARATAPQATVKGAAPMAQDWPLLSNDEIERLAEPFFGGFARKHYHEFAHSIADYLSARTAVPQAGAVLTKHEREVLEYAVSQLAAKGLIGTAQNIERIIKDRT